MYKSKYLIPAILFLALIVAGCNLPSGAPVAPTESFDTIRTIAAQTVVAGFTQSAPLPTATAVVATVVPPTATAAPLPTDTPIPPTATVPPLPTNTPIPPTATPVPIPCDRAAFVQDITYKDNSEVNAGATFTKTWRLSNNGTCTWNSSYSLVFSSGDSMLPSGSPGVFQLTTGTVAPGQQIDVSVELKAPSTTGTYQGYWKLRNGSGVVFGIGNDAQSAFWVKVKVVNPATATPSASVQLDFIAKGPDAQWSNASASLPWGDPAEDSPGVAVSLENVKLNDGKTYAKVLATYPQHVTDGIVKGVYPNYTVQDKDHFKALLGFRANCDSGNVKFVIKYREGSTDTTLGEWLKTCDNGLLSIDVDLAALKGKTVQFILMVSANGSSNDDKSVWVAPRIEH